MNQDEMTKKSVGLLLIKLSFPAMAGMMIYSMFSLVDTFFVARLGSTALAALTIAIPVQVLIISIASATGIGITSLISRTLGSGNVKLADNVAWHGLTIGILYGVLFLFLGNQYIDGILMFFGCTPETFVLSKGYLSIVLTGGIFTFIPLILGNVIQGEGNTFLPMLSALVGMGLNVIFDPLFIFGAGFFTGMGLNGAAVATVCAQALNTIFVIGIILKRRVFLTWALINFKPSLQVVYEIYKVGFPTIIMEIAGVIVMGMFNRVLGGYSSTSIAALGIFLRVRSMLYMPVYGLTQGTMPIAAFAYGAGNFNRVKETIMKASLLAFLYMISAWIILQFYPAWIMGFFSNEPTLTVVGITCIRLATLFLPLMGPFIILLTVFQALGKGFAAMWLSLVKQVGLLLPLLIILPHYYSLNGVWLSFSISEILAAILAAFFLINLWRGLQTENKTTIIMLFKRGYAIKRFLAWLKF